jgi:hypothetical protein
MNGTNLRVIIVMGDRQHRIDDSVAAREQYPNAFIFNDVYNVEDLRARVAPFPSGSISVLQIGGHGTYASLVGVQATSNDTIDQPGQFQSIDSQTLPANADAMTVLTDRLAANGALEFDACGGAWTQRKSDSAQALATALGRRVYWVVGDHVGWDDQTADWRYSVP